LTLNSLFKGNALFIKYYYGKCLSVYKPIALPGRKEGVSGSVVNPTNIGINNYIDEKRKKAAIEFIKFVSLKETQKKYIINNHFFSAMTELYDDEEVCRVTDCDVIKDIYPFSFMNNDIKFFGSDSYNEKYRINMFDFIYNDKSISEVLKIIDDIPRIHMFLLKMDDSNSGLILFIIFLVFVTVTILSIMFLFIKKFNNKFKFLSKSLWIITTSGSLILMSSITTLYGEVTNVKCHLRIALINFGFVLSVCPSLHKLIRNFPESNKVSLWFERNIYISVLIVMAFTLSLNGIYLMSSYDLQDLTTHEEKCYKKCVMNNIFGNIIYYLIQLYDISIILISLVLVYMEWSLEETLMDVNFLSTALLMDILSIILLNIIKLIKFKDYIIYNVLLAINILIFSISNQLFIYFIRILPIFGNNAEEETKIIKELLNSDLKDSKNNSYITSSFNNISIKNSAYTESISKTKLNRPKIKIISQRIASYHNQKSISKV